VGLHEPPQPLGPVHEGVEPVIDEPPAGIAEVDRKWVVGGEWSGFNEAVRPNGIDVGMHEARCLHAALTSREQSKHSRKFSPGEGSRLDYLPKPRSIWPSEGIIKRSQVPSG
jgi:hypothetical protein